MMPRPIEYEKFENDIKDFLKFIVKFDFAISEFPETITFSFEEELQFLELAPDGTTTLSYFFQINGIDHWDYMPELSKNFNIFNKGIEKLKYWASHGIKYPLYLKNELKFLKIAQLDINKLDLSKYTTQNPVLNPSSVVKIRKKHAKAKSTPNSTPIPHTEINLYRELHISYISKSIKIIEELFGTKLETDLVGIPINITYWGDSKINIKHLFKDLSEIFKLEDEDHFIRAFTGEPLSKRYTWPSSYSTGLKFLLKALTENNILDKKKIKYKIGTPWAKLIPTFCKEDGVPYTDILRTYKDANSIEESVNRMIVRFKSFYKMR